MDTPFENLDSEVRREWLAHPTTEALLKTLTMEWQRARGATADAAEQRSSVPFDFLGGQSHALSFVLQLMRKK